jgi:hypothetical protein
MKGTRKNTKFTKSRSEMKSDKKNKQLKKYSQMEQFSKSCSEEIQMCLQYQQVKAMK